MNDPNSPELGPALPAMARRAVATALGVESPEPFEPAGIERATFITITQRGDLRGCIGSLEAHRDLVDDVRENAVSAALRDPRFPPLTPEELDRVRFEVSVLSPLEPLTVTSEDDLLKRLRPGLDGLVIDYRGRRATFLPQVWEDLDTPETFLRHLKLKAHLPAEFWSNEMKVWTYRVDKFIEQERTGT